MNIVISNVKFGFDLGCKILKLKHDTCPFPQLEDFWEDIEPLTFKEISQLINLEHRRVAFLSYGLDKLVKEVKPELLDKKTIKKTTTWVNDKGELITKKFNDTYELYKVAGEYFGKPQSSWQKPEDCYYVRCKDTSTDREYLIWVDLKSVYRTNSDSGGWDFKPEKVNAIQAIAWTIQTNVEEGNIEKIVRQGDCIMIKPKKTKGIGDGIGDNIRHLTEKEYRNLLVAES